PLAAAAEGGEVMLAEQQPGGLVHGVDLEPAAIPEGVVAAQWVRPGQVVTDAVGVPAAQRGEAGVEPVRGRADPGGPDVGGEEPGQPAQGDRRYIEPCRRRQV